MTDEKVNDKIPIIMLGSFLCPIILGTITGIIENDFSSGAGLGAFIMIALWVLCFLSMAFDF
jgi:hypothetical protein